MDLIERTPQDGSFQQESSYGKLFSSNPCPMWVYDRETLAFLDANAAALELYGYSREEFLAMRVTDIRPPEDVPALIDYIETPSPPLRHSGAWRHRAKDGRLMSVLVSSHKIEYGDRPAALVLVTDITERQETERRLAESEQQYRSLFEHNRDAIVMLDREGRLTIANPAAERLTGYDASELIGSHFMRLVAPDRRAAAKATFEQSLTEPHQVESALLRKDGARVEVHASGVPILVGDEVTGIYVVVRDISERRRAEETTRELMAQIHRERERLDDLLSHVPGIVWEHWLEPDPARNRVSFVSRYVEALLGYPASAWVENPGFWLACIHPDDRERAQAEAEEFLQTGVGGVSQFRCIARDGSVVWLESRRARIHDEHGRLVGIRGVDMDITARLQASADLKESEARFRLLAENATDFISRHAPDGTFLYASPSIRTLGGYEPEEMVGRSTFEFINPDFLDAVQQAHADLIGGTELSTTICRFRRKDGTYIWLETAGHVVPDPQTGSFEIHCASRDVTERQEAEEALRHSEERYRLVERATDDVIWDWDLITGELRHNDSLITVFGYRPEDVAHNGQWWYDHTHPQDRARVVEDIWKVIHSGGSYWSGEYRFARGDGTWATVLDRSYVMRSDSGVPLRMIGSMTDITERKRTEETLRFLAAASETLSASLDYHTTLSNLTRMVIPFVADYCAIDVFEEGGAVRRIALAHADPSKEKVLRGIQTPLFAGTHEMHRLLRALHTGRPQLIADVPGDLGADVSAGNPELAGTFQVLQARSYIGVPLHAHGRIFGAISFVVAESGRHYGPADLALATEVARRASIAIDNARLYREIQHADLAKDEFLAMLSHELRNPLSAIANALQLIQLRGHVEAPMQRTLAVVDRQTRHMARLVDDLLDVSRITRGKIELRREVTPLSGMVDQAVQAVQPLIDAREHTLELRLPEEPLWLDADPFRIAQVLSNLLNNAAKYTEPGGHITLTAKRDRDMAVLRIRDTGMGIPKDLLPRVFDMFTQADRSLDRSQGGLGIGLTVVKSLVEMHGGSVRATSDGPGKGSEFIVRLPVAEAPHPEGEAGPEGQPGLAAEPLRILLVEDNVDAARTLSEILSLWGYTVHMAHDGLTALDVAEKSRPDVVLLDIGLPGMDGYEVARRMRTDHPGLHLVALTGYGQEEDQRRSREAGFDTHLVKPVDFDNLHHLLAEMHP